MTSARSGRDRWPGFTAFVTPSDRDDYPRRTWQYLRIAMVAMVAGIGWSVGYEVVHNPRDCWQTSLSAYWYTPAQAMFVGALVTIGVCLFCIKGRAPAEDALLNFAGVLAPVVAIVPTPEPGTCASVLVGERARDAAVANTMQALLVVGLLLFVFVLVVVLRPQPDAPPVGISDQIGYALAGVVYLLSVVTFFAARPTFLRTAHYAAAIPMFACILGVVVLNAVHPYKPRGRWRVLYSVLSVLMVLATIVLVPIGLLGAWEHWLIALESALVALFAVFWLAQSVENWSPNPPAPAPSGTGAPTISRGAAAGGSSRR